MKSPNHFSDEELVKYSELMLAYEIEMLHWTASVLHGYHFAHLADLLPSETIENKIVQATHHAYFDAFAMYSRNLIDFLYLKGHYEKDHSDDVVVEDYIDTATLNSHMLKIKKGDLLDRTKKMIDKRVAHLTSVRLTYDIWDYTGIFRNIFLVFNSIASYFPAAKCSEHFRAIIAQPPPLLFDVKWDTLPTKSQNPFSVCIAIASTELMG